MIYKYQIQNNDLKYNITFPCFLSWLATCPVAMVTLSGWMAKLIWQQVT